MDVYKKIKTFIKENLLMPVDFKKTLVEKNLSRIIHISSILIILSGVYLIIFACRIHNGIQVGPFMWAYYSIMFTMNFFGLVTSIIFLKIKNVNQMIRNIPLSILFIGLMFLGYVMFIYGDKPFNSFLIYMIVATITPIVFAIEPMVYVPILIGIFSFMINQLDFLYGTASVANAWIYIFVLSVFCFQRWFSLIHKHKHEEMEADNKRRIQQEMDMASIVQKSFYRHDLSNIKGWRIATYNEPMLSLSGDLFDFYNKADSLEGLSIFDVSGHGLSAGLVTMLVKNAMKEEFYDNEQFELDFTMRRINQRVKTEKGNIENYLTGILMRFNDMHVEMVNAGHPMPVLYNYENQESKYIECLPEERVGAIGLGDLDFDFRTVEFDLYKNDRIILYTDGITEAKNSKREEYGEDRFLQSIKRTSDLSVEDQINELVQDIKVFIGSAPHNDDISIIILEKK